MTSNLLARQLIESGLITGDVLPFAGAGAAVNLAKRLGRVAVRLDAMNSGDYWVVSVADAERLRAGGYGDDRPNGSTTH